MKNKLTPFGLKIEDELNKRKLKQTQFAEQIGISPPTLSAIMRNAYSTQGYRKYSDESADKVAKALGISR